MPSIRARSSIQQAPLNGKEFNSQLSEGNKFRLRTMPLSRTEQQNSGGAQLEIIGCAAVMESALLSFIEIQKIPSIFPSYPRPVKARENHRGPIITDHHCRGISEENSWNFAMWDSDFAIFGVNMEYTEAGTIEQIRCSEVLYRAINSSESLVEQRLGRARFAIRLIYQPAMVIDMVLSSLRSRSTCDRDAVYCHRLQGFYTCVY